jgi:hypothetical protein
MIYVNYMEKCVPSTTQGFDISRASDFIGDEGSRDNRDRRGPGKEMAGKARFVWRDGTKSLQFPFKKNAKAVK